MHALYRIVVFLCNSSVIKSDLCHTFGFQIVFSNVTIPIYVSELRKGHNEELQSLDKTLKDTEAALTVRSPLFPFSYNKVN